MLIVSACLCAAGLLYGVIQSWRARKMAAENNALRGALIEVKEKAERLQQALAASSKAREVANDERRALTETLDDALVHLANSLFHRM
jgi:hypothetical protein